MQQGHTDNEKKLYFQVIPQIDYVELFTGVAPDKK